MTVQQKTMKTMAAAGLMAAAVMGVSLGSAGSATADAAANLVGSGCAAYAQQVPSGPGSVTGMAQDPVAVAASNNPLLTTLTAAVSGKLNPGVNLVDTLNGGQFTVFAPVDAAFAKLPASTIDHARLRYRIAVGFRLRRVSVQFSVPQVAELVAALGAPSPCGSAHHRRDY